MDSPSLWWMCFPDTIESVIIPEKNKISPILVSWVISLYTYISIWMCVHIYVCLCAFAFGWDAAIYIKHCPTPSVVQSPATLSQVLISFFVDVFLKVQFCESFCCTEIWFHCCIFSKVPTVYDGGRTCKRKPRRLKKAEVSKKVLIRDPEANLAGFFIFLEASLMNVECLGLQHWVQAQSSGS